MALTKEETIEKVEVVGEYKAVGVRVRTIVKEDGVEISNSILRRMVLPSGFWVADDGTFNHPVTDISNEPQEIQDICNVAWTPAIKTAWKNHQEELWTERNSIPEGAPK